MNLSKFEKYVLNKLSATQSKKILDFVSNLVNSYKEFVLTKQLRAKVDTILEGVQGDKAIAKTILNTELQRVLSETRLDAQGIRRSSEYPYSPFELVADVISEYDTLSNIVGVQPISGPVGQVYLLQYQGDFKSLQVIGQPVEARSSKLASSFSVDIAADMEMHYGDTMASELTKVLGSEIKSEITTAVLDNLLRLAKPVEQIVDTSTSGSNPTVLASINFNIAAHDIAHRTRRGAGNFLVMSLETYTELVSHDSDGTTITDIPEQTNYGHALTYAGKFNTFAIYISTLPQFADYKVLVGYNGKNGAVDTGLVVSPYMPAIPSGVLVRPDTYEPSIGFTNRTGYTLNKNAENFYRLVDLSKILAL